MADPMIRLQIARSDVAFIHDVLMGSHFSGAQMLQAAGIIAGLRPALAPAPAEPEAEPEAKPEAEPEAKPEAKRGEPIPCGVQRPAKRKR